MAFSLAATVAGSAVRDESHPSAIVVRLQCAKAECVVVHDRKSRKLRSLMPLYPGDEVIFRGDMGEIEIGLADKSTIKLGSGNHEVEIPDISQPDGFLWTFWSEVASGFRREKQNEETASARAETIGPALLSLCPAAPAGGHYKLAKLDASVTLIVRGGTGPFHADIADSSGNRLSGDDSVKSRVIVLRGTALMAGPANLRVTDMSRKSEPLDMQLDIAGRPPQASELPDMNGASPGARDAVRYGWLAFEGDGEWALEAVSEAHDAGAGDAFEDLCGLTE